MSLTEAQEYFKTPTKNPYLFEDITENIVDGKTVPVQKTAPNGATYYVASKDSTSIKYAENYQDSLLGNYKTDRYNINDVAEKSAFLEMNKQSTPHSIAAKQQAFSTDRDKIIKPGVMNLENPGVHYTKGMDQISSMIHMMSNEVCGTLGDIFAMGFQSDILRMINIALCLMNKAAAIGKILTDASAAQNIFAKINALKKRNPAKALAVLNKLNGKAVNGALTKDIETMCKLFFNIIDNFAGDMKNFLRDILNAPIDLAKAAERFLNKMINDVSREVMDCVRRANDMVTIGSVIDAIIMDDKNSLDRILAGNTLQWNKYLPVGASIGQLIEAGPGGIGKLMNSMPSINPIDGVIAGDLSTAAFNTMSTGTTTQTASDIMTNVMDDINAGNGTSTGGGADYVQSSYLAELSEELKKKGN